MWNSEKPKKAVEREEILQTAVKRKGGKGEISDGREGKGRSKGARRRD